jgi:hypothetical protein
MRTSHSIDPEPSNNDRHTESPMSDFKRTIALLKCELRDEVNIQLDEFFLKIERVEAENESKPEHDLFMNLLVPMLNIKFKTLALERWHRMVGGSTDTYSPREVIEEFVNSRRNRNMGLRELDVANYFERVLSQNEAEPLNAWRHLDNYMTDVEGEEKM